VKELVGFITCGFPDKEFAKELGAALIGSGCDRLELGLPFSDPVADGELIEKAGQIAIKNGYKKADAFEIASSLRGDAKLYFMGYFNSFFSGGFDAFCVDAANAGVGGLIIPDLPFEEGAKYADSFGRNNLSNISFLAVTHTKERIKKIAEGSKDFIYLVAFAGITGADKSEDLSQILADVREFTDTKVFVGFGVNEKTAKERVMGADGVIVGSAFTKLLLDESLNGSQKIKACADLASKIKELINC